MPAEKGKKICIVTSCGGHLTEVRMHRAAYSKYEHFYVLNDKIGLPADMEGRTHFVTLFERDLKFFVNLGEAWTILRKEKPDLILSTGAGIVVPFALWAKLFGIPVIFLETLNRIKRPSLTARLMYYFSDRFFYQWESLRGYFPRGEHCGPIL